MTGEGVVRQQRHHITRPLCADEFRAVQDGAGQPRVRADGRHPAATIGDPAECPSVASRRCSSVVAASRADVRWRVGQCEARRRPGSPHSAVVSANSAEVGGGDLRQRVRAPDVDVLLRRPAAEGAARRLASGPAGALLGGRLRHPGGDQRAEPARLIGARFARQPGVHHGSHAGHRQRTLGHRRRDHDDPAPRPGSEGEVLLGARLAPEQRPARRQPTPSQRPADGRDLPLPRYEDQYVARRPRVECTPGDVRDVLEQPADPPASPGSSGSGRGGAAQTMSSGYVADVGGHDRCVQHPGERRGVRRRRCRHQREIGVAASPGRRCRTPTADRRPAAARGTRRSRRLRSPGSSGSRCMRRTSSPVRHHLDPHPRTADPLAAHRVTDPPARLLTQQVS